MGIKINNLNNMVSLYGLIKVHPNVSGGEN
jgi:hypothetical protein